MTQPDPADPLRDAYGDAPLVQSRAPSGVVRTRIQDISTAMEGQLVCFWQHTIICSRLCAVTLPWRLLSGIVNQALAQVHVRGRLELVSGKGKACFLKIRQRTHTIQVSLPCSHASSCHDPRCPVHPMLL